MKLRKLCAVTLILPLCAVGAVLAQSPPTDLHLVGDHWTAWDPPSELPEGAEVHTIVSGDTLWDLAGQFYGDPYLWPQLWEQNQYILDAHWIYPGDPLVVSVEVTPVGQLGDVDLGGGGGDDDDDDGGFRIRAASIAPQPLGSEDDIYCSGYIGEDSEEFGYSITGSEYQALSPSLHGGASVNEGHGLYGPRESVKVDLSSGDIIYLDGGRAGGLSPGLLFTVVEPGDTVSNPFTGERVGRMYSYKGRVRVLSVQSDSAIAEIVQSCDPIHVEDTLKPFVPEPVPLGRRTGMMPPNDPVADEALAGAPVILRSKDGAVSLGEDHVVFLDRGVDDGIAPGDLFTIYRRNRPGSPPIVLGELAILSVHERASVGKIIESRYTVYVGDVLDPK